MFRSVMKTLVGITLLSGCSSTEMIRGERAPSSETGNSVFFVEDADTALKVRWDLLEKENREIFANFHVWDPNGIGGYSLAKLCLKARAGVKVRLIVDAFNMNLWGNEAIGGALVKAVTNVCTFNGEPMMSLRFWNPRKTSSISTVLKEKTFRRDHDKILYLDELQTAYEGDRNWQNVNFRQKPDKPGYTYFSVDAVVQGPLVNDVKAYLEDVWANAVTYNPTMVTKEQKTRIVQQSKGSPTKVNIPLSIEEYFPEMFDEKLADLTGKMSEIVTGMKDFSLNAPDWRKNGKPVASVRFLHNDPQQRLSGTEESTVTDELIRLIDSAQERLFISTPFLRLPERLFIAIQDRALKGIKVELLTSNPDSYLLPPLYQFQNRDIKRLQKAGVKIFSNTGPDDLHVKTVIVDSKKFYLGTHNLNMRSEELDLESGFLFDDANAAQFMENYLIGNREDYKIKKSLSHFLLSPIVKPFLKIKFINEQL